MPSLHGIKDSVRIIYKKALRKEGVYSLSNKNETISSFLLIDKIAFSTLTKRFAVNKSSLTK